MLKAKRLPDATDGTKQWRITFYPMLLIAVVLFLAIVQMTGKTLSFEVLPGKWVPIINFSWGVALQRS